MNANCGSVFHSAFRVPRSAFEEVQSPCIRPPPLSGWLVQRGAIARAHRPALSLATHAGAVALLDGTEEAFLTRVIEDCWQLDRRPPVVAELLGHRRRVDDLAGI